MSSAENIPARIAELEAEIRSLRAQPGGNAPAVRKDDELLSDVAFTNGVLESSDDCIKVISLAGNLLYMSGGGQRVMEVDDFEKLRGCNWPTFWPGEGQEKAEKAVASARAGKASFFEGPAPTAKGTPRYWEVSVVPIFDANGTPDRILSISRDVTTRQKSHQQQEILARELHHRVNNTLAVVSAITTQSIRAAANLQEADLAIAGRIRALAKAHTLLLDRNVIVTTVADVVKSSIAPYDESESRISFKGPRVEMSARPSVSLALALNELGTNATKYGALSVKGGKVAVQWTADDGKLHLTWQESGGPAVAAPTRKSFGSTLIRSTFGGYSGGTVDIKYETNGLVCIFEVPVAALIEEN